MKVRDLRTAIEKLRLTEPHWQSADAQAEIDALTRLLAKQDETPIADFCARVESASDKKGRRSRAANTSKPLNEVGIARYLEELNGAREDNATFEAIIQRLKKDRSILMAEAIEIARRFTGKKPSGRTKAAAFSAILDRQITDKRSTQRIRQVPGLF